MHLLNFITLLVQIFYLVQLTFFFVLTLVIYEFQVVTYIDTSRYILLLLYIHIVFQEDNIILFDIYEKCVSDATS